MVQPLLMGFLLLLFVGFKYAGALFGQDVNGFVKMHYTLLARMTLMGATLLCNTMYIPTSTVKINKYLCKPRFRSAIS